ncbi:MAG TPA: translocation/assembly module TamB domain-containing protein, partial [Vicinamibacteria bacterium]|nr:translocation/assembly module TamB domain-containing protein [Vicinamibacteria bacterium]
MSTPLSRALSRAARVLFALLILFVLSLALLHTPLVQRGLARFLSSQASRAIEGRVTVGDVAYRLWRGEAVLESVTAESDAMLPGLSYELRARRIEVRLRTTPLSITVRVESPELTLRSDARSRSSSGDDAGYASAEPLEPRLPSWLAGLKIADGRLRFESRGDELDVASIDLELEDSHEGYRGSLEVGGGAVAFRNARFELKRAELVALGGEDGAEIPRAHLQLDGARAEAKGIVERLRPLVSRFDVELSIEASLLGVLTSSSPMKGRISSRLVLSFGDKGSRVSGELEARELEIGQIGPIDVGAGLRFEDDVLAIAPFEVEGYRGTLDGAAELDFRRGGTQSVEVTFAHVSLERILDELAGEAAIASSLEGSVRARLQDWSLETLDGEAEFALTGLDGRHPRPASGSISVNAEDGIIAFRSRELDIGQAATRLDGTITPSDFRVNFRVEQLDLATLTGALPDSIPASTRGVIGFEGTASGDGLEPDALDIEARLLPSTFETGEELFDLRGWARISQGRLHVIDLALESRSGTGRLEAGGTIELESGRLKDVRLAGKEIRARFDPWAGLIERIDVELSGPLASPSGSLALDLAGTSIRGRELPAFSITARSNGETATGAARYAGGEFLTAELQLRRKYPIVVQLELDRAPLPEALSLWIGDGVPGPRVVASGHVSGRADLAPFSRVSFRGSVETLEAELRGVDLRAKAPFTFEGDLSHAAVSNLVVAGEKTALEVDGVLALGEDADHDLRVAGVLGLKELEAFAREARVDGEVDLDLRLEGEPGAPSLTGRAILQDGSFLRSPLEVREVHLLLEADDDRITLERLSGKLLGGTLAAEGALDFCAGQTASSALGGELRIDARELDLAPLLEGTEDVQDASLILSALAAVEMGGLHVRELEGTGTISKLLVRVAGKEVTAGPASLRLSDARLEFSPLRFEGEGIDLVTEAEVTLSPNLPWSFTARGDADLALANAFLPEAAASGSVRLDLDASGGRQREELQLTGSAELDGASFRVDQPPLVVSDVEARVMLDSHRMVLERLQGRLGGGTLRAEGFYAPFASGDGERVSIRSNATDVRLEYPEGLRSTTSAELAFQNEGRGYLLSGEVRLREAIYDRDVTVERELLSLLSREAAVIQRQRSFAERIRIDLHAESEDGLRVRNNLAHTSLTADLDATGTLAAPELRGRVNTRAGGTIFFGGRTYELELARVTLDGYPLSAPIVDVSAHTEVGGTPIRLEVTGRTDELSTNLRAPEDPSL